MRSNVILHKTNCMQIGVQFHNFSVNTLFTVLARRAQTLVIWRMFFNLIYQAIFRTGDRCSDGYETNSADYINPRPESLPVYFQSVGQSYPDNQRMSSKYTANSRRLISSLKMRVSVATISRASHLFLIARRILRAMVAYKCI